MPEASNSPSLPVPDALIEAIAERAAELVVERIGTGDGSDGWLRGADAIASYIGSPPSRVYALAACDPQRIPVHRDGSALVARRSDLDGWMRNGGGTRP